MKEIADVLIEKPNGEIKCEKCKVIFQNAFIYNAFHFDDYCKIKNKNDWHKMKVELDRMDEND